MKPKLKVTQIRSGAGRIPNQRKVLAGLGLRGPHSSVTTTRRPSAG
jgi:ribosomal protein L30